MNPGLETSVDCAHGPQVIVYADRFGGTLTGVAHLMRTQFAGVFNGVHLLPFYSPFDGADAGFDPVDHTQVDPRLGTWADIQTLSKDTDIVADVIVNHMSSSSPEFEDVRARGDASPWSPMFLTMKRIFPVGATEEDLARIYRPRPGLPFTVIRLGGTVRLVWTTFTSQQVDLDLREPVVWDYLSVVIDQLTRSGVTIIRLDAVGYTGKAAGSNCFMTKESIEFIHRLTEYAHQRGAAVLPEVHGHYTQQVEIARDADLVYDFALPPLVLHAIFERDPGPLAKWLALRPTNAVTVLDTHDGIGIVDAGANELPPFQPGLLSDAQITKLVESIHSNSGGTSRVATGVAASNLDLHQVNCTFYDALGRDDYRLLLARAIQLFVPGIPQVYYVGLLAGTNDMGLLAETGVGRDVNRHRYSSSEIDEQLLRPVVRAQLRLIRFRAEHPAFKGELDHETADGRMRLRWRTESDEATLEADMSRAFFTISFSSNGKTEFMNNRDLLCSS